MDASYVLPTRLKAVTLVVAFCLAVPLAVLAETGESQPEVIVAHVGSGVITQKEYEQALRAVAETRARRANMAGRPAPGFMTEEERKEVLDGMIDARVLSILAKDAGIDVPSTLLSGQVSSLKSRFPSEADFDKMLAERGMTFDDLEESIRDRFRVREFIRQKTETITASEEEVKEQYEKQVKQGLLDTVDVSHILIKVLSADEKVWEEAKQRIDAARARIVKGEDFAEVAKEVSEDPGSAKNGGLFPNTPRGEMPPDFDRIAFTIPIGELSQPFRTEFGWHILKTSGRGKVPLQIIAPRISKEVALRKRREEMQRLVEEAKKNMKIEVNLPASAPVESTPLTGESEAGNAGAAAPDKPDADIPLPDEAS